MVALAVTVLAGLAIPSSADASYMIKCNALIDEHIKCIAQDGVAGCTEMQANIEEECKCHQFHPNIPSWKTVMAAVAKDGVCGDRDPKDPPLIKDPSPPPGGGHGGGDNIETKPEPEGRGDAGPGGGHK